MKTLYLVKDRFVKKFETLSKFTYLSKNYINESLPYNKEYNSAEYFYSHNKKFIYPLYIGSNNVFRKDLPTLPSTVVNFIKEKKGIVVFFYLNEGNFYTLEQFKVVDEWAKKCGFTKEHVFFFCSNHKIRETYHNYIKENKISDNISYSGVTYFESCLWSFKGIERRMTHQLPVIQENLRSAFSKIDYSTKRFYFNCLNRKPRGERIFLSSLIKSFYSTSSLTSLSIGDQSVLSGSYKLEEIPYSTTIKNKEELKAVNKFLKGNFDKMKSDGYSLDFKDLGKPGSDKFNSNFYNDSFISVVVETEHDDRIMFLSEKTFKPIIMHQPFFLIGNKNNLDFLKELGYKTFDKWWDESYDNYDNIYDRVYYAFQEIKKICELDKKSLSFIVEDMYQVLEHNFNHYFTNKRYVEEFYPLLKLCQND